MLVKSQVKYIQSLGQKKVRDEEAVFVAEGPKIVGELMAAPGVRPVQVFAVREWIEGMEAALASGGRSSGASGGTAGGSAGGHLHDGNGGKADRPWRYDLTEVTESELGRLSSLSTPNQVVAVFGKPVFPAVDLAGAVSLVLDGIQDPGNMGTIVRIADWFGVSQVVASRDSADVFSAKAIQSTMGSISRVQVLYADLPALLGQYAGVPVYAAVLGGVSLYELPRLEKGMIVIGNESKGIREEVRVLASRGITIPRIGGAESLNAGVATGIILSHLLH